MVNRFHFTIALRNFPHVLNASWESVKCGKSRRPFTFERAYSDWDAWILATLQISSKDLANSQVGGGSKEANMWKMFYFGYWCDYNNLQRQFIVHVLNRSSFQFVNISLLHFDPRFPIVNVLQKCSPSSTYCLWTSETRLGAVC